MTMAPDTSTNKSVGYNDLVAFVQSCDTLLPRYQYRMIALLADLPHRDTHCPIYCLLCQYFRMKLVFCIKFRE